MEEKTMFESCVYFSSSCSSFLRDKKRGIRLDFWEEPGVDPDVFVCLFVCLFFIGDLSFSLQGSLPLCSSQIDLQLLLLQFLCVLGVGVCVRVCSFLYFRGKGGTGLIFGKIWGRPRCFPKWGTSLPPNSTTRPPPSPFAARK